MERVACVDVPALALQLLLRDRPTWRDHAVVVVQDDRPQGLVRWANTKARSHRVLPGMTFAAASSLCHELRAATVSDDELSQVCSELHLALCNFTPRVEPSSTSPGVFWLDPAGLVPLYGSLEQWATTVIEHLRGRGFDATLVVGFHRYRAYALARTRSFAGASWARSSAWVVPDPHIESRQAARVPLVSLDISPDLRDQLSILGVQTLGGLLRLPATELRMRFGEEAARLHAQASDRHHPLQPRPLTDPIRDSFQLEPPDADHHRLLFGLKRLLHRLADNLAARSQAISVLHVRLDLDHAPAHDEYVEPASPTLDVPMLLDLVRLRLESLQLPAAIEAVRIELEGVRATTQQLALFRTRSRRDLEAGARALARIRASMGERAVSRASLRPAHLPEAGFTWEPLERLQFPDPIALADGESPPLMRRILPKPVPLPARPRHEPEAWLGHRGAVVAMHGPFRVSGGWWVRMVERDYYYVETQNGDILWVFYDRPRRRWFMHGFVD